ncbi:unnamed protein product [Callosobruchus maculatus]|uniref:Cyclin N-terminal domain-containing protein n=1 Tax=Callosobruchus maculatus TaxID=64391 RepID=A0A653BXS2_CALMS|nr:unnamed protein product [Callosobruchus maculatus]
MDAIRRENKENHEQASKNTMAANPSKRVGLNTRSTNAVNQAKQPLGDSNKLNVEVNVETKKNISEDECSKENRKNLVNPIVPVAQFEAFKVYEDDGYDERMARIEEKLKKKVKKSGLVQVYKGTAEDRFYTKTEVAELERKKREEEAAAKKSELLLTPISSPMSIEKTNDENVVETDDSVLWGRKSIKDMFFEVEEYREVIYKYLREHELKHRPKSGYMKKQPDVTSDMRTILVDWLVEVAEEYRLSTESLYLAVNFIDRFLSYMSVVRTKLQLVGTAAMFLASKYEEIYPPAIREFVYITDDTYTKRQVIRMEQLILKVLGFDLSVPTPLSFITAICSMNKINEKTTYLAMYLSELSLLNGDVYLEFLPSAIAASAIAIARHTLAEQDCWTSDLVESTGYELVHLRPCIEFLSGMFASAQKMPQHAIQDKYKSQRYLHVSSIRPLNEPIVFT